MQRELLHLEELEERTMEDEGVEHNATTPAAESSRRPSRFTKKDRYTTEFYYNMISLQFRSKLHEQAFCQIFDETSGNQFFVSVRMVTWVVIVGFQLVKLVALLASEAEKQTSKKRIPGDDLRTSELSIV
eukprot:g31622.t1